MSKTQKSSNQWIEFLKQHKNTGHSISELRDLYKANKGAPTVYIYDDKADIKKNSALEQIKNDKSLFPKGINAINRKLTLKQLDDITDKERIAWMFAFELSLSDEYGLSKQQLLSSHDWWINRLSQENDEEEIDNIISRLESKNHKDIYEFLDDVLNSFSIEQLYSIGHPDMS